MVPATEEQRCGRAEDIGEDCDGIERVCLVFFLVSFEPGGVARGKEGMKEKNERKQRREEIHCRCREL